MHAKSDAENAEAFGVDLRLVENTLSLSVDERVRQHCERVRAYQRMQARTISAAERQALRRAQIAAAIEQWGASVPS